MSRLRVRPSHLRASTEALAAEARYERALGSSERGRRARAIQERGYRVQQEQGPNAAWPLFAQAAEFFVESDNGAAAASARFDLARALMDRTHQHERLDLEEARELLQTVVRCDARRAAPIRHARDLDALAQVHRRLSLVRPSGEQAATYADGLRYSAEACRVAERAGPLGWKDLPGYLHNRANIHRKQGDIALALADEREALRYVLGAVDENNRPYDLQLDRRIHWQVPMMVAADLLELGRETDLPEARRLAERAASAQPDDRIDGTILLAAILRRSGDGASADEMLLQIDARVLARDSQLQLARELHRVGHDERALHVLRFMRQEGHGRRHNTLAEREADRVAAEMQEAARLEAKINHERGDAVLGFLALEATSGLRYVDAASRYTRAPADRIENELELIKLGADNLAVQIDTLASNISVYPTPGDARAQLAEHMHHYNVELAAGRIPDTNPSFIEAVSAAVQAENPVYELKGRARDLVRRGQAANRAWEARSGSSGTDDLAFELSPERLAALLEEQPDAVLVRVVMADVWLAFAVWLEDSVLRAHSVDLRPSEPLPTSDAGTPTGLVQLAERIDLADLLSPVFGGDGVAPQRIVLLPSAVASMLPWAAVRCGDRRLVECFESIEQLPSLYPLEARQAPRRPRSGTVCVAPGSIERAPTHLHGLAFDGVATNELLAGTAATTDGVVERARVADVVTFYAHGLHDGGDVAAPESDLTAAAGLGGLELADGRFYPFVDGDVWAGCERVELWACETGVNRSTDELSPIVDEGLGIDIVFHHTGVRSTVGTLWPVLELATALIARHYRSLIDAGARAPFALVGAQRWWTREAVATIVDVFRSTPSGDVQEALRDRLGLAVGADGLLRVLGPIEDDQEVDEARLSEFAARLRSPVVWAGFRFVGVCERRPTGAPPRGLDEPLTDDECAEVERLIEEASEEALPWDDALDDELNELRGARPDGSIHSPDAERAIEIARRYFVRRRDSREHNLLRGAAWLAEARTRAADTEDQARLDAELCWHWLELARGELVSERHRVAAPRPPSGYLERLATALPRCAASDRVVLESWYAWLLAPALDSPPQDVERVLDAVSLPLARFEDWRRTAGGAPLVAPWLGVEWTESLISNADFSNTTLTAPLLADLLGHVLEARGELPSAPLVGASQRELARLVQLALSRPDLPTEGRNRLLDAALNELEGCYWGYVAADDRLAYTSTGSPGAAWLHAVSILSAGRVHGQVRAERLVNVMASYQAGGAWQLAVERGATALEAARSSSESELAITASEHSRTIAAALRDVGRIRTQLDGDIRADAFRQGAATLEKPGHLALPEWTLLQHVDAFTVRNGQAHATLAFAAEHALCVGELASVRSPELVSQVADAHERLQASGASALMGTVLQDLRPMRSVVCAQRALQHPADDDIRLVLVAGVGMRVQAAAVWREGSRLNAASTITEPGTLLGLRYAVAQRVQDLDAPIPRSSSGDLTGVEAGWNALTAALQGVLSQVPDSNRRTLRVFSPTTLSGAPIGPANALGVAAIVHTVVVASGSPQVTGVGSMAAAVLGDGETPLLEGLAVDLAKRDPLKLVTADLERGDFNLPEIEELKAGASGIARIIIASECDHLSLTPSTEAFSLRGGRSAVADRHLSALTLLSRPVVELWYAPGGYSEAQTVLQGTELAVPTTVRRLLGRGAGAVVDIATDVPEVLRWLVFATLWANCPADAVVGPSDLADAVHFVQKQLAELVEGGECERDLAALVARTAKMSGIAEPQLEDLPAVRDLHRDEYYAAFRWWELSLTCTSPET